MTLLARSMIGRVFCALALIMVAQHVLAQGPPAPQAAGDKPAAALLFPTDSVSTHAVEVGSRRVSFTTTAGTLPSMGAKGETTAHIFFVAYAVEDKTQRRPVTFVFNGGPGAAAAFLHLAAMGPRVINFSDNGAAALRPVQIVDNPDTWLDFTDLVFVDPVGTGYSRSVAGTEEADRAFFGVDKDADALSDFVRLYLARAGRTLDPVFLAGESYGGFRVALLAERLLGSGAEVRGAVMISPALEFSMLRANRYAIEPLALILPSLAAVNLELREGPGGSLEALTEIERFARTGYLVHLASGIKNDPAVNDLLARYTGLEPDVVARHRGRVSARTFTSEFEKSSDRARSNYDATVSAPVPRGSNVRFDPILDGAVLVLEPALTRYVRGDLGYRTDLRYRLLNRDISGHWDYGTTATRQGFAGALDQLQQARMHNPSLGVLITHGYTDLVTPYSMSRYLIDQLTPIDTARPIELKVYRGGHMMYLRPASRRALTQDARAFYGDILKAP